MANAAASPAKTTTERVRAILAARAKVSITEVGDSSDLFAAGALDSLGILEAIAELESAFGVSIPAEALTPENFESIGSISEMLDGLLSS